MTEQEKREKVIKGLECCITYRCEECPYRYICFGDNMVGLFDALAGDALALLKAQEPRVITVKDFENNPNVDHDGFLPAWIEYRRDGDWNEYWGDQPDEWGICKEDRIVYESMRYWTSRPTDAQREAEPWNAQK